MRLMLWLAVWLRRLVVLAILFAIGLSVPIAYTEYSCKGPPTGTAAPVTLSAAARAYAALPHYALTRAHADYAATVAAGDPHAFGYLPAVTGYWRAACAAVGGAAAAGGLPAGSKLAIYGDGASLTALFLAKAAYEETLGRIAILLRGSERAALDTLSAEQADGFARFLAGPRGPGWDHGAAALALIEQRGPTPRDWERMIALNIEYRVRGLLGLLVALPEPPPPPATLRAVVTGTTPEALAAIPGVSVLGPRSDGLQIETASGAAALTPLTAIAAAGGIVIDVAGTTEVLLTVSAPAGDDLGALVRLPGPGGENRLILALPVTQLAPALMAYREGQVRAELLLGN